MHASASLLGVLTCCAIGGLARASRDRAHGERIVQIGLADLSPLAALAARNHLSRSEDGARFWAAAKCGPHAWILLRFAGLN